MALFLKDEEVRQCVSMDDMIDAIETMQRHYGNGEAYNLARRKIIASGGMLSVMGGGLHYQGMLGVKTYTVVKGVYSFQVSLYDAETGKLLCYTQANRLGQLRTGATSGVAVRHLAKSGASSIGIIGTGGQAPTQLEAVTKVRNIKKITAYSRNHERREAFARSVGDTLGIEVAAADTNRQAVEGSDIIICIAATTTPVLEGEWLTAGNTVIGAGPTSWRHQEVDDATFAKADKIFVDSSEQATVEAGDMASAVDRGLLQWSQLLELRHAVAGKVKGRDNDQQIIYAKLMGTGVADVAAAALAYEKAKASGLGMEMDW